jgi:phenylalanyl-tRNA synthetase beta chain
MKITEQWLRSWANPSLTTDELVAQLTMAGLEVEAVSPVANDFTKVVVAEVIDVQPHPNADRLRVCQVNVGKETLQIVCGASNVATGLKVPAALIGAEISADFIIKASKLRGVDSFGMLCSAVELGIAESSDGLLILPADAPVGTDIRNYLQLNDHVIEISITPNRGDCLSIMGIAREVAALTHATYQPQSCTAVPAVIDEQLSIRLSAPEACPRYAGRIIRGINSNATTPLWMAECLRRVGIRSIHPVVDVTNYVMLELGQPMHAFDVKHVQGGIDVRYATAGESLTLLDGKTISIQPHTLVIADDKKALALAGIMGGLESSVTTDTCDIFLESAFFNPLHVTGKARQYGLHTDSSFRFERGVDYQLPAKAIERATALLLQITGGQPGPVTLVETVAAMPATKTVTLTHARIGRLLGADISPEWVEKHLPLLGLSLVRQSQQPLAWTVTVPSYRFDIAIEADLLEEIARLYGYNHIPTRLPVTTLAAQAASESTLNLRQLRHILTARDYSEAISYSFVEPRLQELLDPATKPYVLANPISPELSVMRTSLLQGLLSAYLYNQARQAQRVRLFETGLRFVPNEQGLLQQPMLAGLCAGAVFAEQWGERARAVDFFDIKSDVEALLALRFDNQPVEFVPQAHSALHPGRSAGILVNSQPIGYIGALHPRIVDALDIRQPLYVFELQLDSLRAAYLPEFATLSKYPSVRRDIAVVVKRNVPVASLQQVCKEICGELLLDNRLFDVYEGKGIADGERSLAFALTLQHATRTLTDQEIADLMEKVVAELQQRFGAVLRE